MAYEVRDEVTAGDVVREVVEEVVEEVAAEVDVEVVGVATEEVVGAGEVAGVVVDEVDVEVVQLYAIVVDSVPSVTTDTEVTTPSTNPFVHTDRGFPGGPIDRSVLTKYVGHVALRLWHGEVHVFYI